MAVPILFELNGELTRLFAAGSRLAAGDARVKKYIAPLKKYGEKAPVFLKLASLLEELTEADAAASASKLIETETFLLSVLATQGETSPEGDFIEFAGDCADGTEVATNLSHRDLAPLVEALTSSGGGRFEVIKSAYESGVFKDPRLYKFASGALGDRYSELADYAARTLVPGMGEGVIPFVMENYDYKGGPIDARKLLAMHSIKGSEMLALVDEAADGGSTVVKAHAAKIMGNYPKYEDKLVLMLDENKAVREEAMSALVKIDSHKGIDKMLEWFKIGKDDLAYYTIADGDGEYLTAALLNTAQEDYEKFRRGEHTLKAAQSIQRDLTALREKKSDDLVRFCETLLNEDYLDIADELIKKEEKILRNKMSDLALKCLYDTGMGEEYIWRRFVDSQSSAIDKLIGRKKQEPSKTLCAYAFEIGSYKLNIDEFYTMFFKSNIFKKVYDKDYWLFNYAFIEEGCPYGYSEKIKNYLEGDKEFVHLYHRYVDKYCKEEK